MTLEIHLPLAEDSGATAYDFTGNEHHATINGAGPQGTGTVTGPFGNSAFDFDGSDDTVVPPSGAPSPSSLDVSSGISISVWFNVDSASEDHTLAASDPGGSTDNDAILHLISNGNIRWTTFDGSPHGLSTGTGSSIQTTVTYSANVWTHVTGVYDGGTYILYKNGVEEQRHTDDWVATSSTPFDIGRSNVSGGKPNGTISDWRIYDRILSPQEVQYLYQAGVTSELTMNKV